MNTEPQERERLATAYHEAGHAVVSLFFNIGVKAVRLTPGDEKGRLGVCEGYGIRRRVDEMERDAARRFLEPRIIIYFAGQLAEAEFLTAEPETFHGHGSDDESALDLACYACGSEAETQAFQVWLFERTRNVVRQCWPQIRAVATALAEKEKLTGQEVRELMQSTLTGGSHR